MSDSVNRVRYDKCLNPLNLPDHSYKKTKLRRLSQDLLIKLNLTESPDVRICDSCRKKVYKLSFSSNEILCETSGSCDDKHKSSDDRASEESEKSASSSGSSVNEQGVGNIEDVNKSLVSIGESPIKKRKLLQKRYPREKLQKVTSSLAKKVFRVEDSAVTSTEKSDNNDIIRKLIESFHKTNDNTLKVKILTIFEDWSYSKIKEHFEASDHMIRVAKKLAKENGILSSPGIKIGKPLELSIVSKVLEFYRSDEISRVMPGKKNFVSVKEEGQKVHKQKRLILCNLKETYRCFKDKYPLVKISFSKFAELRPKECILPGANGTHSVCVCIYHENVKLLIEGANIPLLTSNSNMVIKNYKDALLHIICNPPSHHCYLKQCSSCPGPDNIIKHIQQQFDAESVEQVTYKQWVTVDRTNLETLQSSTDDLLDKLSNKLMSLLPHVFIAQQQSQFLAECKDNLQPGNYVVIADYSENYSFIVQDSVQGVHWNNCQATIHPFSVYFKENGEIRHKSIVAISENLKHDTDSFHLFQSEAINLLKQEFENIRKIIYFSDGSSSQYKNKKNFKNICLHEEDYKISAEWHFFATSHGKGPCDGIGGTLKRLATRASLQPGQDPLTTPKKLFDWASKNIDNISFLFCPLNKHKIHSEKLQARYHNLKPVTGTLKLHSFIPLSKTEAIVKHFSFQEESRRVKI